MWLKKEIWLIDRVCGLMWVMGEGWQGMRPSHLLSYGTSFDSWAIMSCLYAGQDSIPLLLLVRIQNHTHPAEVERKPVGFLKGKKSRRLCVIIHSPYGGGQVKGIDWGQI